MKSYRFFIVLAVCLFFTLPLLAQQVSNTRADKQFNKAVQMYYHHEYAAALRQLDDLLSYEPTYAKAWIVKGEMYNDQNDFPNAIASYKKAVEIDTSVFPPAYYIMANLNFSLENYVEAKTNYLKYLTFKPKKQTEIKQSAENLLLCDFRIQMMQHPVPFNPVNIGPNINTSGYEYINAVSLDEGQLYFTRKGADPRSDESFYRSVSARSANGQLNWSPAIEIGAPINTPGNEGALCVSPDGMTIIITCCSRKDSYGSCDLYSSEKVGNNWSEPQNLGPRINTSAWESQPCLAADGRTLFFISSRPGGYGGSDIWKSILQTDGSWAEPVNLGNIINTPADEMAPFIHPDGHTLYFSSRGHQGMGGADLFVSRMDPKGNWQNPDNIGYPVNTKLDEINLIINAKGNEAFISAERDKGFGNTDIYRFELPRQSRPASVSYVKGKVYDNKTTIPLAAAFELIDMQSNTTVVSSLSDPVTGEFLMSLPVDKNYALNVSCKGYLFYSINFSLNHGNDSINPVKLDVPLQAVAVGEKVVLNNIFFDTDKFDLLPDSKAELGTLIAFLSKNPAMHIEIGGHTDNEGDAIRNLNLSQARADVIVYELVKRGIPPEQLFARGYGETRPKVPNDTAANRAINRRVEFIVTTG
ncbi:MAG: OmpA family protein [Bacteroidota bacterium]